MGVFFERKNGNSPLTPILEVAYSQPPPPDDLLEREAERLTSSFNPVRATVQAALTSEPPDDPNAVAQVAAQAASDSMTGSQTFQSSRFLVAMAIFLALLGTAIGADASGLTSSTTALYGLVSSVFGVIVGLLGGEMNS